MSAALKLSAPPKRHSQDEEITPAMAAKYLEANTSNRRLKPGKVQAIAEDIVAGRWRYNDFSIQFSWDGILLDGQHRLHAIIAAGIPVLARVTRNMPPETRDVIDNGAGRSAADVLGLAGVQYSHVVAAAARAAILFSTNRNLSAPLSRTAVTEFQVLRPYIVEAAKLAVPVKQLNTSPLAAVIFLANEKRLFDEDIASFLHGLKTGENLTKGDPRLTLREWSTTERIRHRGSIPPIHAFSASARAWTAHARGERLLQLKISDAPHASRTQIVGFSPSGS